MTADLPDEVRRCLAELAAQPIPVTAKGFGPLAAEGPVSAAALASRAPHLHAAGLSYPILTLRDAALRNNIDGMAVYAAAAGIELVPHGKTMMAPQLAARQLAAGAWGITVATIGQLQTYRRFGFPRLLLANELVDPAGIRWLAAELDGAPAFEAYCYVDSPAGVALLDGVLRECGSSRPLPVLVELGFPGGRTGARDLPTALAVARAAARTGTLRVAGAAGYEGGIGHHGDPATLAAVADYCRRIRELGELLCREGVCGPEPLLSAGGSAFFDVVVAELTRPLVADARATVLLRSGAYLTHDHGFYHGISPAERHAAGRLELLPALELWAPVLSRPEDTLALLGVGRRDVSFDEGLPVPLGTRRLDGGTEVASGMTIERLNDQHAYLRLPADRHLSAGDLVCLGISHPCTTFDKWQHIPVVADDDRILDVVHTFF